MNTQLDAKQELLKKIQLLSYSDMQKLKVFLAGLEAGKQLAERESKKAG